MPMGDLGNEDRLDQYWSLDDVRAEYARSYTVTDLAERTGGPARYVRLEETGQKIGFITPLTHNFCESCNRVRLTCTGELYMEFKSKDFSNAPRVLKIRKLKVGLTGRPNAAPVLDGIDLDIRAGETHCLVGESGSGKSVTSLAAMDPLPGVMILVPILAPISFALGIDPNHFAIIVIVNLTLGLTTPPVGSLIFVVSSTVHLKPSALIREMPPFFLALATALLLITFIPALSVWLPQVSGF